MQRETRDARSKRLCVRVSAEEAARLKSAAAERGLTTADFIRTAVLGRDRRSRLARRLLEADVACTIRELSRIASDLHQLRTLTETGGMIAQDELSRCLAEVRDAMAGFAK